MNQPRAWKIRIPMNILRWVLLALYLLIVLVLFGLGMEDGDNLGPAALMLALFIGPQALFIFGAGTVEMCKPIHRPRLWIPVLVAATMMTILMAAVTGAIFELFRLSQLPMADVAIWTIIGGSWLAWLFIFLICTQRLERFAAMRRMVLWIMSGSLLSFLITIPAHVIVSRRPGCLVGLGTMLAIIAGCIVLFWSFGPGIILLYLRDRRDRERALTENHP